MSDSTYETLTIPEAGARYFKLSKRSSYEAAKEGKIPTIKIPGERNRLVPVRLIEARIRELEEAALAECRQKTSAGK